MENCQQGAEEQKPVVKRNRKAKPAPRICRFFKTPAGCRNGDNCKFRHIGSSGLVNAIEQLESVKISTSSKQESIYYPPNSSAPSTHRVQPQILSIKSSDIGTEKQTKLLSSEIEFFAKRFQPKFQKRIDEETSNIRASFEYVVTDPEWIFDVKKICFSIELTPKHPIEKPVMMIESEMNERIPLVALDYMERKCNEIIEEKYKLFEKRDSYETIGKALVKWLDRAILQLFVDGLKLTKLSMNTDDIGMRLHQPGKNITKVEENKTMVAEENDSENQEPNREQNQEQMEEQMDEEHEESNINSMEDEVRGNIECKIAYPINLALKWKDLSGNVATIESTALRIAFKCTRCGQECDSESKPNETLSSWRCAKCSQGLSLRLRGEIVHENSNIISRLESKGCRPLECILLESTFTIRCLGCDKSELLQKLNYGDTHKSWCKNCHKLFELVINAIRFQGDLQSCKEEDKNAARSIPKAKKLIESFGKIEEGQPLPQNGACEHYSKSFRWFRFPCCGRTFPCDLCHEEKKTNEHEMKRANRMICGFCSKEQMFSDNECSSCGKTMTKRRTQFWEGGKGCRDQSKMNKNDAHKFVSKKKTVSAKAKQQKVSEKP